MQVKSIAECSKGHSEILLAFNKLPFVIKTFVLSVFEWPFYTGFTVGLSICNKHHLSLVFAHIDIAWWIVSQTHRTSLT